MSAKWVCSRKIRYAERAPANKSVGPYLCETCGGYHMSSQYADNVWLDGWTTTRRIGPPLPVAALQTPPKILPYEDSMYIMRYGKDAWREWKANKGMRT